MIKMMNKYKNKMGKGCAEDKAIQPRRHRTRIQTKAETLELSSNRQSFIE